MLRTIITLAIILNAVGLYAQKQNPRGIYHMVSITGKYGTEAAMLDQYKICTDTMTWMLSVIEDKSINKHWERANRPYFELGDNDHMVFNYTGEEPDVTTPTMTRIFNSDKKGFSLKWWSTSRGHRVFPENGWCTEEYKSNSFSSSGKKIFDMLYSTKTKGKKDGLQGRWKVIGAIKMSGSKVVDEWQKSGKVDLKDNDYVPYQDEYAIIDDQYIFTAYSEVMPNQQTPNMMYGYLQEYQVCDESGRTITVEMIANDDTRPLKYVFHRISNDRMIVKEERVLFDSKSRQLADYIYAIWERTESNTPIIQQITSKSTFRDRPKIEPRGLYRYVAGGDPCRIRELRDSLISGLDYKERVYCETYKLCTDTINWQIEIRDSKPSAQTVGDNFLDYQPIKIHISNREFDPDNLYGWVKFYCSETGFSETMIEGEIWTYDNRCVTPKAQELMNVLEGKIPYDANHPLYGTWEVEGRVLNPSEAKIDSIIKGLCTDYVFPYIRNARCFYAYTPQYLYPMRSGSNSISLDKLDSDGKTFLVTREPYYSKEEKKTILVNLNWKVYWLGQNKFLLYRDHQELFPIIPVCFVMKRKIGGESLVNVLTRRNPSSSTSSWPNK